MIRMCHDKDVLDYANVQLCVIQARAVSQCVLFIDEVEFGCKARTNKRNDNLMNDVGLYHSLSSAFSHCVERHINIGRSFINM